MTTSGEYLDLPTANRGRGRRKATGFLLARSDLILDVLHEDRLRRRGRFEAALSQDGFATRCIAENLSSRPNQQSIAKYIKVTLRVLNAWLNVDEDRPNALTLMHRQRLAKLICGDERFEPWLSEGTCFDWHGELIAPDWAVTRTAIHELEMAAQVTATVHASKLAQKEWKFSRIVTLVHTHQVWEMPKTPYSDTTLKTFEAPDAKLSANKESGGKGRDDEDVFITSDVLDASSSLDAWRLAIQASGLEGRYDAEAFGRVISTLNRAGYSIIALWRRFPELTIDAWNTSVAGTWLDSKYRKRAARPRKAKGASESKPRSIGRSKRQ